MDATRLGRPTLGAWRQRARGGLTALMLAALLLALFGSSVVWLEEQFIYFPLRALVGTPADIGLAYHDATFETTDGVRLHGWFVPGRGSVTLLWLHGNAGNVSHRLDHLLLLHERLGVHVFIIDYRGYGRSEGQPSEEGTYRDATAALTYLRQLPGVDPERVVLYGQSLGSAVAAELARREPVRGVILEAPFASIAAMARVAFPFLPLGPLLRTRYDTLAAVREIDAPLLVLHSPTDEVVPYAQGEAVYAAAREPKWFHAIGGRAGHNDAYLRGGAAYWQALADFLARLGSPGA